MSLNNACRQAARRSVQHTHGPQADINECGCDPYAHLGDGAHARRVFERCGQAGKLWDVEDLVKSCSSSSGGCPYYTAHVLAGNADIVFCPHNYILDPAVSQCRSHHRERWSLEGRIVIVDEAHNLEQGCRDAGSIVLPLSELQQLVAKVDGLLQRRPNLRVRVGKQELQCAELCARLRQVPFLLAEFLGTQAQRGASRIPTPQGVQPEPLAGLSRVWGLPGYSPTADFAQHSGLMRRGVLGHDVEEMCVEVARILLQSQAVGDAAAEDAALLGVLDRLQELLFKLRLASRHPESYVVGLASAASAMSQDSSASLAVWLMSPGVIFDTFASQAHAVLLASGTLAPLGALGTELAASSAFTARAQREGPLETPHVVQNAQVLVTVASCFPESGCPAVATYDSWRSSNFISELGKTLASISEAVPGGVLCFFPSYASLESCVAAWRATIWSSFTRVKGAVVVEPRDSEGLAKVCSEFVDAVRGLRRGVER